MALLSDWWLPDIGGTERHIAALGRHLVEEGHDVAVVHASARAGLPAREVSAGLSTVRVHIPRRGPPLADEAALRDEARLVWPVISSLWPGGPDILHAHSTRTSRRLLATAPAGAPLVVHLHVRWPAAPAEGADLLARAAAVIAPSRAVRDELLAERDLPPERVRVAPTWIDVDDWTPVEREPVRRRLGLGEGDRAVLFVGRVEPSKGLRHLTAALRQVMARHPGVRLLVAGPIADETERARAASDLDPAAIAWLGALPFAEMPALLAAADVFVLPSTEETQGLAVLEAMAGGKPVIAGDLPALRELIEPGRTGLLVPPGDPAALAEAIEDVLSHPDRARRLGDAAREVARTRWSRAARAPRFTEIYDDLCVPHRPRLAPRGDAALETS